MAPKHLYHATTMKAAKQITKDRYIDASCESNGDAFLGDGVYFTAIPVEWADPEVVRKNNFGGIWKQFKYWNKANAYIRVDFEPLDEMFDIEYKTDWQSSFCIKVPKGKLLLTKKINAVIRWDHKNDEWDWEAQWQWPDRRHWPASSEGVVQVKVD